MPHLLWRRLPQAVSEQPRRGNANTKTALQRNRSIAFRSPRQARDCARLARTVIAVTHSLLLPTEADRVLVLNVGKLVEEGSHHELLASGTFYSRLWQQRLTLS
jgi:hypothetical protein